MEEVRQLLKFMTCGRGRRKYRGKQDPSLRGIPSENCKQESLLLSVPLENGRNDSLRSHLPLEHASKQNSLLLSLPLELTFEIVSYLQLPVVILLSQTCSQLWHQFHIKSSAALLDSHERFDHLMVLAYYLPDFQLCSPCKALHSINPKDVPGSIFHECCFRATHEEYRYTHLPVTKYYYLEFRHVQLALKYTRLRNIHQIHQRYRADLLRKYTMNDPSHILYSAILSFTAEPVVVQNRFILRTTFEFYNFDKTLSAKTLMEQGPFCICPHLRNESWRDWESDALLKVISRAFDAVGSQVDQEIYSCSYCPTDYVIEIQRDRAIIHIWMDLGCGVTHLDPYWRSHANVYKGLSPGPRFSYKHGSIRELYCTSPTSLLYKDEGPLEKSCKTTKKPWNGTHHPQLLIPANLVK